MRQLITLGLLLAPSASAAAPQPSQILKAVGNPASFKPTSTDNLDTDSGAGAKQWMWGEKYSEKEVRLEMIGGNKKAWLWQSSLNTLKLSQIGPVKKLLKFDSGMQGGVTLTGYQITGGPLKGNFVQVTDFGKGEISTSIFARAYMNAWAQGPDAVSGLRQIRGYFPIYLYLTDKSSLCSREDFQCY
ncbi:hypothetical protein ACFOPQ_01205 [Deinococcus antarcticus]|uniref:Uncharacterized protein n=1 Tax=Deinococcus antarcticus TaxID=1298767 RepID=A0ABV8A4D7_9DEIO